MEVQTPYELLRSTVKRIEAALRKELLDRILDAPLAFFTGVIVNLLLAMGCGGSRIRHNVGVRVDETLYLKKVDEDFFVEE